MLRHHSVPGRSIPFLEGEPRGKGAVTLNDRIGAVVIGPVNIRPQNKTIIDRDGHIPINAHSITGFADIILSLAIRHLYSPPYFIMKRYVYNRMGSRTRLVF